MGIPDLSQLGFKAAPSNEKPLTRHRKETAMIKYRAGRSVWKDVFFKGEAVGVLPGGKIGTVSPDLKGYLNEPQGTVTRPAEGGGIRVTTKPPYTYTHEAQGANNVARILSKESSNDVLRNAGYDDRIGRAVVIRGPVRYSDTTETDWQEAWNSLWASSVGLHPTVYAVVNTKANGVKYLVQGGSDMNNLLNGDVSDLGVEYAAPLRDAIKKASSFGVIMTDIKPGNIVYMPDKTVMFIDLDPHMTLMAADEMYASAECCEFVNILMLLSYMYCNVRVHRPNLVAALTAGIVENYTEIAREGIENKQGQICAFLHQAMFKHSANRSNGGFVSDLSAETTSPEVIVLNILSNAKHYMNQETGRDQRVRACRLWEAENGNFMDYIKMYVIEEIRKPLPSENPVPTVEDDDL